MKKRGQGDQAEKAPEGVRHQNGHPKNEPLALSEEPPVTAEREKLIQKAMGLHREQQKMLDSLTGEQRQKLALLAHFFLFKGPPKDEE